MKRRFYITIIAALCLLILFGSNCAPSLPSYSEITKTQRQLNIESFDRVWETIYNEYWDPEFGGTDRKEVRRVMRPMIAKATSMSAVRYLMVYMTSLINSSHFGIIPSEVYSYMDRPVGAGSPDGVTGMDVRMIDNHVLITSVERDSPADKLGLQTGWEVVTINGRSITDILNTVEDTHDGPLKTDLSIQRKLRGRIGDTLTVQLLDANNDIITLKIPLIEQKGNRIRYGHMPAIYSRIDVKRLVNNIGYIAFNYFFDPAHVLKTFEEAMESFMDTDGIIIDLRGNGGGIHEMVLRMMGWLIDEQERHIGTFYTRNDIIELVVKRREENYQGLIAVLVDGLSGSSSELFARELQLLGRAKIIGSRTKGELLPAQIIRLPNGDGFFFSTANFVTSDKRRIEGIGVIPDIHVMPSREDLLQGRDTVLEAAKKWILKAYAENFHAGIEESER